MIKYFVILFALAQVLSSAPNTTTVEGADPVRFYLRNYAYANMSSNLPILSIGLATDLNRILYKNSSGVVYKIMADASGSSNTPQGRVFYSDGNGAGSSSSSLTFANDKLSITGKLATTDSVKGGNAEFTGRVTGTDMDVSDSVKAVSGSFSGALTGTTLNTGNGANELYPMNQGVRSTDPVSFLSQIISDQLKTVLSIGGASSLTASKTPTSIVLDKSYSDTIAALRGKLFLLKDSATGNVFSFGVGANSDLQYYSTRTHDFYIKDVRKVRIDSTGLQTDSIKLGSGGYIKGDATNGETFKNGVNASDFRALDTVIGVTGKFTGDVIVSDDIFGDNLIVDSITSASIRANGNVEATDTVKAGLAIKAPKGMFDKAITDTLRSVNNANENITLSTDPVYGYGIKINSNQLRVSTDLLTPKLSFGTLADPGQSFSSGSGYLTLGTPGSSLHDQQVIIDELAADSSLIINGDTLIARRIKSRVFGDTGTVTLTAYGYTTSPTVNVKYVKIGDLITLSIPAVNGTSNSASFYLGSLPSELTPDAPTYTTFSNEFYTNATYKKSIPVLVNTSGNLYFHYHADNDGNWPTSGQKRWYQRGTITYSLK